MSFRACGISVAIDGSEDGEIHCFKEGGVEADARTAINTKTSRLLTEDCREDDPNLPSSYRGLQGR